jgi:hypothetical protein
LNTQPQKLFSVSLCLSPEGQSYLLPRFRMASVAIRAVKGTIGSMAAVAVVD